MTELLTIEKIRDLMRDRQPGILAAETGLHYQTIYNIRSGKRLPDYATLVALSEYFNRQATKW